MNYHISKLILPCISPRTMNDLDSLVQCANNINISKFLMNKFPFPHTEEDGKKFISFATKENQPNVFAIEIDGKAVGGIGIHPQSDVECKNAEMGYCLAKPCWGRGIITAAIHQMIGYSFKTFDINRILPGHSVLIPLRKKCWKKLALCWKLHLKKHFLRMWSTCMSGCMRRGGNETKYLMF